MKSATFKSSNDDISVTCRPINFLFDTRCLVSAASEPQGLPTCFNEKPVGKLARALPSFKRL